MKRVGIYSRSNQTSPTWDNINTQILDGLKWMYLNNYDSFNLYTELVDNEYTDMSDRIELNRLIYDSENGHIDAVFISDIKIFSPISIKAMQAIISLQEVGMHVYHTNGHINANDENIKMFKEQLEENWKRINETTKDIQFGG